MTYEFCLFDPADAANAVSAREAWDASAYIGSSAPDLQRDARKWRIKEGLHAFNPALQFSEPEAPGLLSGLRKNANQPNYLLLCSWPPGDAEECTNYHIYDQAVEVTLPFDPPADAMEGLMRDTWRHLEYLSAAGLSVIYDTERDVLLDLDADFDAVMAKFRANLADDGANSCVEADDTDTSETPVFNAGADASARPPPAPEVTAGEFKGNVPEEKPWWKFW